MYPDFSPAEASAIVQGLRDAVRRSDRPCIVRGVNLLAAYAIQVAHDHPQPAIVFGSPNEAGGEFGELVFELEGLAVDVDPTAEMPMAAAGGLAKSVLFQMVVKLLWKRFVDPDATEIPGWLADILELLG